MWRTASLSIFTVLLGYAAGAWLTGDFSIWTAEGARRLTVLQTPVAAPAVAMQGTMPGVTALPALLRRERGATLVGFVYSRCQTVCLALGSTFQQLQARLQADGDPTAARIRLLSISFDPQHDTPPVLAAYAHRLQADPQRWQFAVPLQDADLRALLDRFGVVVIDDGLGGYEHNAALLVVDGSGRLVRIFDYADADLALAWTLELAAAGAPR